METCPSLLTTQLVLLCSPRDRKRDLNWQELVSTGTCDLRSGRALLNVAVRFGQAGIVHQSAPLTQVPFTAALVLHFIRSVGLVLP